MAEQAILLDPPWKMSLEQDGTLDLAWLKRRILALEEKLEEHESRDQIVWSGYISPLASKLFELVDLLNKGGFFKEEKQAQEQAQKPTSCDCERCAAGRWDVVMEPGMALSEVKRRYVLSELERNEGNKTRTALGLGLNVSTLRHRLYRNDKA